MERQRMYKYPIVRKNGRKDRLHRFVMEEHLGRNLYPGEAVYHKDGDGWNNDISNLVLIQKRVKQE